MIKIYAIKSEEQAWYRHTYLTSYCMLTRMPANVTFYMALLLMTFHDNDVTPKFARICAGSEFKLMKMPICEATNN